MNILAIGDVVSTVGCEYLRKKLPSLKKMYGVDFCIVNGENSAAGNGITPQSADFLFDSGVDLITTGNHVFRRREIYDRLDTDPNIIRPANYYAGNPGKGFAVCDMGSVKIGVINLAGNAFMEGANPFTAADGVLKKLDECRIVLCDFHAEATGEKRALGFYLDGRVSAVFGTHTHVQTADEQILPNGTGYITDLGMVGTMNSVLGVTPEAIITKLKTGMPTRFDNNEGECMLNACLFEIDKHSGKTTAVQRINIRG
ncbi:MAG: TIGR00282 family metallophosphoesterase [Clostridia bacterium]|nr:TIGR00282 family metallophosphoesterase [Clostridia bacterium]MBQ7102259.1 TIGR00282 family metallophosphoesterase [Clostridia bacterium]